MPGYTILIDDDDDPYMMLNSVRLIKAWATMEEATRHEIVKQLEDEKDRNQFHFGSGI